MTIPNIMCLASGSRFICYLLTHNGHVRFLSVIASFLLVVLQARVPFHHVGTSVKPSKKWVDEQSNKDKCGYLWDVHQGTGR